jgi:hypothetical protein
MQLPTNKIKYPAKFVSDDDLYVCWWEWLTDKEMWWFESAIFENHAEGNKFYQELNLLT